MTVVVVGSGHAGVQVAASLRDAHYNEPVVVFGSEPEPPYHRPPLSKAVLLDPGATPHELRNRTFFESRQITLRLGTRVVDIDRGARQVFTHTGDHVAYSHLVLATGSRNRALTVAGAELPEVHELRTHGHAKALRDRLLPTSSLVIIGGGFIGLEVASALVGRVRRVTVIEAADRVLARSCSEVVSSFLHGAHSDAGVEIRTSVGVTAIEPGRAPGAVIVQDTTGLGHHANAVLVGIGAEADSELGFKAGLAEAPASAGGGLQVGPDLLTSDPRIYAIGDVAQFPWRGRSLRLESVQNAVDQARYVAAHIAGRSDGNYNQTPWFWSDQGEHRIQIAGVLTRSTHTVVRGDPSTGAFSTFNFSGERLVCVESVNQPRDHMLARRILDRGINVPPAAATDLAYDLRSLTA